MASSATNGLFALRAPMVKCREEAVARRLCGFRESSRSGAKRETGGEACEGGAGHVARCAVGMADGCKVRGERSFLFTSWYSLLFFLIHVSFQGLLISV